MFYNLIMIDKKPHDMLKEERECYTIVKMWNNINCGHFLL